MSIYIESQYKKTLEKRLNIELELRSLPCGYISKKVIHGKTQYYLQRRSGKKIIGKYITDNEVKATEKGLLKRDALESQLLSLNTRISELESAAKLIDSNLYNKLLLLKACIPMDHLSADEKQKASSFATAMNAVEGIYASEETQNSVREWIMGEASFLSVYEKTLKKYGFPVEVR